MLWIDCANERYVAGSDTSNRSRKPSLLCYPGYTSSVSFQTMHLRPDAMGRAPTVATAKPACRENAESDDAVSAALSFTLPGMSSPHRIPPDLRFTFIRRARTCYSASQSRHPPSLLHLKVAQPF